jgi:hypothetical protein
MSGEIVVFNHAAEGGFLIRSEGYGVVGRHNSVSGEAVDLRRRVFWKEDGNLLRLRD